MSTAHTHSYEPIAESEAYRDLNRQLLDMVDLHPGAEVLDLGCGTGSLTELMEAHDVKVWAVDPDPEMLAVVRRRASDRVCTLEGSAETFGAFFDDASLDAVFLANAIHLVPDISNLLTQAARILRPGGTMAFNTAFFVGADDPSTRPLLWRLVLDARKLVPRSRDVATTRPLAKRPLTEAYFRELLTRRGFRSVTTRRVTVPLTSDLLGAIVSSPIFAAGALPGADPDLAAKALNSVVQRVTEARPTLQFHRTWLYVTAETATERGVVMTGSTTEPRLDELIDAVAEEIVALRPSEFSRDQIQPLTLLYTLGPDEDPSLDLDSLDALELIAALEGRFGCELDDDVDLESIRTVSDIARAVLRSI